MADLDRLKLKFTPWHCDKEPYGFVSFMQSNTAVMRSLNCGAAIEDYLDIKLGRTAVQDMMVSSIINDDPDFARPIEMPTRAESQGEEATSGDSELIYSSVNTTGSAAPASTASGQSKKSQATTILPSTGSYYALSTGARQLDVTPTAFVPLLEPLCFFGSIVKYVPWYVQYFCIVTPQNDFLFNS